LSAELVSKISNLCDPDPPTSQTDGRSHCKTALCSIYSASRGIIRHLMPHIATSYTATCGNAEFARLENDGPQKNYSWKMLDLEKTD